MLENLKKLNPDIEVFSIKDDEFKKYGRVIDFDSSEIVSAGEKIELPREGTVYVPSEPLFESLNSAKAIHELIAGGCDAQIGVCLGYNSYMNALEFHKSSEINIAITPLVLILGLEYDMDKNEYDSSKVKAFYLEKGDIVEVFGTSLHYCPCQVSDDGFKMVVGLLKGTNEALKYEPKDKLIFANNKWLICHDQNKGLIEKGIYPGIHGVNYKINY